MRLAANRPMFSTVLSKADVGTNETVEAAAVRGMNSKRNRSNSSATVAVVKKQRMEEGYCDAARNT